MDKKLAKAEQGSEEDSSSNPAKAEEIKKEKIAVALTYGTTVTPALPTFAVPPLVACPNEPMNSPRIHAPGPASCRGPEPGPSAGPLSDHTTASPSPRSPVSSPAPSDGRPVRARRATPAAAALIASAKAARERQNRSKDCKESAKAAAVAAAAAEEEAKRSKPTRGPRRCSGKGSSKAASAAKPAGKTEGSCAKRSRAGRRKAAAIPTPPDDDARSCDDENDTGSN